MSELKRRKFDKIMDHRDYISSKGATAISNLNSAVNEAVEFSILLEEDPHQYFSANGDKQEIREDFEIVMQSLSEVLPKIELIRQLKDEEITIEQFKSLISQIEGMSGIASFDVIAYQKRLTKSS